MKITYIHHSGVMVELENCVLLFDYWKGKLTFPENKPRYIFISHSHHDHYNPEVFAMGGEVIADEGIMHQGKTQIHSLKPGDKLALDELNISAFGSTDEGVSFMVETEGKRIFHAGDLNYWHWKDESTKDEVNEAKDKFEMEIAKIPKVKVDLAMFPVDARIGSDFDLGALMYINQFKPAYFLPIHFSAHPEKVDVFARKAEVFTNVLRADQGIAIFEI